MKYLNSKPIQTLKNLNTAALRRFAGGTLHPSSTATGLSGMVIDPETGAAELYITPEHESSFTATNRAAMSTTRKFTRSLPGPTGEQTK